MTATESREHSPLYMGFIIATVTVFGLNLFFNYFNGTRDGVLFINTIGDTSDYFYFEVTPVSWAFGIWGLIYTWLVLQAIYFVVSLFRCTPEGRLYSTPPVVPWPAYAVYILNLCCVISWLFAFDRRIAGLSLFFLFMCPVTLAVSLFLCFRHTERNIQFFKGINQRWELILVNIFVYNAWAVYMGWTLCATLLNLGFSMIYSESEISQEASGITVLTILLILILVLCPLELTIFDKHLRYVFAHYIGPLMALAGSIDKQGDTIDNPSILNGNFHKPSGVNRTYAIVILGILLVFILAKIVNMIVRSWKQPLYYDNCSTSVDISTKTTPSSGKAGGEKDPIPA